MRPIGLLASMALVVVGCGGELGSEVGEVGEGVVDGGGSKDVAGESHYTDPGPTDPCNCPDPQGPSDKGATPDTTDVMTDAPLDQHQGPEDIMEDAPKDVMADVPKDVALDTKDVKVEVDTFDPHDVADCGPGICIDCACKCPDGSFVPYGGCFDGCDEIPPEIQNCSMDCSTVCNDATGQPCGFGDDCPKGYICVEEPCEMCGIPPQPICVPEPCAVDGCYLDSHCGSQMECYGEEIWAGKAGQCLQKYGPPNCWEDAECPPDATCEGQIHCPPCFECAMLTMPGHCEAKVGKEGVYLWVDGGYFLPGSQAKPVWFNFDVMDVYLAGCTTYTIEIKDQVSGKWVDQGPPADCVWEGYAKKVTPGDAYEAMTLSLGTGSPDGFATYRLHGLYWTGCADGQPISQAGCKAGPVDVYSNVFSVGPPPP